MKYDYIALDCSNLIISGAFKLKNLRTEEQETGAIFGFFRDVLFLAEYFKTNKFLFVWDSRESDRLEIYPDYKWTRRQKRKDDPEMDKVFNAVFEQIAKIQQFHLPELGFRNQFSQRGKEADDLLADLVLNYENILMVSGDEDMFQLLDMCDIWQPRKNVLWNERKFKKEYGIEPRQWAEVKAIGGCKTDDVAGIDGVGEKKAIQYILGEMNPDTKTYKNIVAGTDIIERNRHLVTLPMEGTIECYIEKDKLDYQAFKRMCDELEFETFKNQDTRWWNFFHGRI